MSQLLSPILIKRWFLPILSVLMLFGTSAKGADALGSALQQTFIWRATAETANEYTVFRKTFTATDVSVASMAIFADSRYTLWVNGQYVERGPCRFDPVGPQYDVVNIAPFLTTGSNTVTVMVMTFRYGSVASGKSKRHVAGLTARITAGTGAAAVTIPTDNTWKLKTNLRYKTADVRWPFVNDTVDARLDDGDWTSAAYDDSSWIAATPMAGTSWGPLTARTIPMLKEEEVLVDQSVTFPLTFAPGQVRYLTLPRTVQGYYEIDVDGGETAGSTLRVEVGQLGSATGISSTYGSSFNYTAKSGSQKCFTTDSFGFRYVKITAGTGSFTLHNFRVVDRRYPFTDAGNFNSSDPFLNELWLRSRQTMKVCSEDGFMDCALREKAEWLGDAAVVQYPVSRVMFAGPSVEGQAPASDAGLMKNMIRHIGQSSSGGKLKAHAPSDRGDASYEKHAYIEDYSCLWVQSLREMYEHTGDIALVNEMWAPLEAQLQLFLNQRSAARGLLSAREFVIFDNPLRYVTCEGATINAFFYRALLDAAILADATGRTSKATEYRTAADALKTSFNQYLWDATNQTYYGGLTSTGAVQTTVDGGGALSPVSTHHAAMIALYCGIVPEDRIPAVRQYFLGLYKSTVAYPYTAFWALENLYAMDEAARDTESLAYIRSKWATMMQRTDTDTLAEAFVTTEYAHNFGASPAYFLSTKVLGVSMKGPKTNGSLLIEPRIGDLTYANGNVVTELGVVPVSWQKTGGGIKLSCTVPPGATATVRITRSNLLLPPTVTINGAASGSATLEGRYAVVILSAGTHEVAVSADLTWQGDGATNSWDLTTANWKDSSGNTTLFGTDVEAIFGDEGSRSPAISLSGILTPRGVKINSNSDYTFGGTGSLGGALSLTKAGRGKLTLVQNHSYSSGTTLKGGVLEIMQSDSLGSGSLTMEGGQLAFGNDMTLFTPILISGSASASINTQGRNVAQQGTITSLAGASGGLIKSGLGVYSIRTGPSYTGPTLIEGGTLRLDPTPVLPSISGLLYQLDASASSTLSLSGSNVTAWRDRVGGTLSFNQATSTAQPTRVPNVQNGLPVVRFSGNSKLVLPTSTAPKEVVAVVNVKSGSELIGGLLGINGADTGVRLNSSAGTWAPDTVGTATITTINGIVTNAYTANQAHILHRYGSAWGNWGTTGLGQYYSAGTRYITADVGEILVYSNSLSAADRTKLQTYLKAKWFGQGVGGASITLPNMTDVVLFNAGSTLDLNGMNQTIASLSGSNGTLVLLGESTLNTGSGGTDTTFAGSLSGTGSLVKSGDGIWTVSGNQSMAGPVTVSGGTLRLSGSFSNITTLTIQAGATLDLQGGTLTGTQIQIETGGTLMGYGTLNIAISNQGTISLSGGVMTLQGALTNAGTFRMLGGSLAGSGPFSNSGVWDIMTASQTLPANFTNSGIILDASKVSIKGVSSSAGSLAIRIDSYQGHGYQLQVSTSMMPDTWQNVGESQMGTGAEILFNVPMEELAPKRFYRIVVAP